MSMVDESEWAAIQLVLAVLLIIVFVAGCAPPVWYRDNTTQVDFDRDAIECRYEAEKAVAGNPSPLGKLWAVGLAWLFIYARRRVMA
jgi:hypothetical protein